MVKPAITMLTIDMSLMRILSDGPEVSLKGSPTVSPTMVALWANEPLPPKLPSSTIFLALSHAPPALAIKTARVKPPASPPTNRPKTPATPSTQPTTIGMAMRFQRRNHSRECLCLRGCQEFRGTDGEPLQPSSEQHDLQPPW